jgi:hypothetical protein
LLTAREEDGRKIERAVKPREAAQREERPATAAISGLTMPSDSETLPIEQAFEPSRLFGARQEFPISVLLNLPTPGT